MTNSYIDLLLLSFSLLGWGVLVHDRLKLESAFIPIFIFSSITCAVFIAGLLNFMPNMVSFIFYAGIIIGCIYMFLFIRKKYLLKGLFTPSTIFFIAFALYCTYLLKGVILLHYDNFSHWGLIVKEMFRIDGLPDGTTLVTFRNYPPGSAVFIYFVGKIIGYTESHALMAQSLLIAANLSVLLVFCKWKKTIYTLLSVVAGLSLLLVIKNNIFDLLVDTLLGIVALSITVIAYYYKDNWLKNIIVNLPLLILLLLIKDTGKLFLVTNFLLIICILYAYNIKGKKEKLKQGKILVYASILLLLVPLFTNFLWVRYVDRAYPATTYESNKFVFSADKINKINKSKELISNLAPKLIKAATDPHTNNFKSILLVNGISLLFAFGLYFGKRKISKLLLFTIFYTALVYILYILMLYIVYLYLMPEVEARFLAGFERYQSTAVIYCVGLLMFANLYEWSKLAYSNKNRLFIVVSALCFVCLFTYPFINNISNLTTKPDIESSIRFKVKTEFEKITTIGANNPKVLYYSPQSKDDMGYLYNLLIYEQHSTNFNYFTNCSSRVEKDNLLSVLKQSNYFVVINSDKNLSKCLSQFVNLGNPKGTYRINYLGSKLVLTPLK